MMHAIARRWPWSMIAVLSVLLLGVAQAQLGGMAQVTPLARQEAQGLSEVQLAWVADRVTLTEPVTHQHERGFVYAESQAHMLTVGDQAMTVEAGGGAAVSTEAHTHSPGTFMEIRLAAPGAQPLEGSTRVFASEVLQGIPAGTVNLQFADVILPPSGGQTTVHTHPGTETIYARAGTFEYQSALHGTEMLQVGAVRSLPPDTPVQKRNPSGEEAAFLALFIVAPDRPLAPEARFEATPAPLPDTGIRVESMWAIFVLSLSVLLAGMALRWRSWQSR
jgi:hypothetical protein